MNLYSVYDAAMQLYMAPFAAHNNGHALRMFVDTVNNPESMFYKHPDDFTLDHIGTFDEKTGEIAGSPVRIAKATDWVNASAHVKQLDIEEAIKRKKGAA